MVVHLARENASDFYGGRFFAAGDGVSLGDLLGRFAMWVSSNYWRCWGIWMSASLSLDLDYGIVGKSNLGF